MVVFLLVKVVLIPLAKDDRTYCVSLYQLPRKNSLLSVIVIAVVLLEMVSHPKTRGSRCSLSCCGIRERSYLGANKSILSF